MKQVKRIIGTLLSAAVIFPFALKAEAVSLAGLSAKAAILIERSLQKKTKNKDFPWQAPRR